jgi:hypothetical protein
MPSNLRSSGKKATPAFIAEAGGAGLDILPLHPDGPGVDRLGAEDRLGRLGSACTEEACESYDFAWMDVEGNLAEARVLVEALRHEDGVPGRLVLPAESGSALLFDLGEFPAEHVGYQLQAGELGEFPGVRHSTVA